jgi:hypothetical protein
MEETPVVQPTRMNEKAYYLKTGRPVEAVRGLQFRMQVRVQLDMLSRLSNLPREEEAERTSGPDHCVNI